MRYAVIIAGGSGTRLWPMSTKALPKQLIPFFQGRSLLRIAMDRLANLLPRERIYICAGEAHREVMLENLPDLAPEQFIAEPMGRDTLNAVGLATGVLGRHDPDATVAIFTADHIIEPVDEFARIVDRGFQLAERSPQTLVTFGVTPTRPATGYGYLQLGDAIDAPDAPDKSDARDARLVTQFKEKPDAATAERYVAQGPNQYLWNSGMFVWNAQTLMDCIRRFAPENFAGLQAVLAAWDTPQRDAVLGEAYPTLPKISVDYAVMEPASRDADVRVAAAPMALRWLDVGSWPSFAQAQHPDDNGVVAEGCQTVNLDSRNLTLASDDPEHLIATIGCKDLVIIHTRRATLVCPASQAEKIKILHARIAQELGDAYL